MAHSGLLPVAEYTRARPSAPCLLVAPGVNARSIVVIRKEAAKKRELRRGAQLPWTFEDPDRRQCRRNRFSDRRRTGITFAKCFAVLPLQDPHGGAQLLIGTGRGIARYEPGRVAPTLAAARILSSACISPRNCAPALNLDYPTNSL